MRIKKSELFAKKYEIVAELENLKRRTPYAPGKEFIDSKIAAIEDLVSEYKLWANEHVFVDDPCVDRVYEDINSHYSWCKEYIKRYFP